MNIRFSNPVNLKVLQQKLSERKAAIEAGQARIARRIAEIPKDRLYEIAEYEARVFPDPETRAAARAVLDAFFVLTMVAGQKSTLGNFPPTMEKARLIHAALQSVMREIDYYPMHGDFPVTEVEKIAEAWNKLQADPSLRHAIFDPQDDPLGQAVKRLQENIVGFSDGMADFPNAYRTKLADIDREFDDKWFRFSDDAAKTAVELMRLKKVDAAIAEALDAGLQAVELPLPVAQGGALDLSVETFGHGEARPDPTFSAADLAQQIQVQVNNRAEALARTAAPEPDLEAPEPEPEPYYRYG